MPARPLVAWPLIALLAAAPAAAQDAPTNAEPQGEAQGEAQTPPTTEEAPTAPAPAAPAEAPDAAPEGAQQPPPATGEGQAGTEEGGIGLSLGDDGEPQVGEVYVRETFGDWELRCERAESGDDPCQLYQLLEDQEGNAVAEISAFALPENGQAVAGATIVTPLMTLLTEQITLSVDGAGSKRYPFSWCSAIGCIARVGFTEEEVQSFRRGNTAQLSIVPAAAPDQRVNLAVSLSGFTAGFEAVAASTPAITPTPAAE